MTSAERADLRNCPYWFDPFSRRYCAARHRGWIPGFVGISLPLDLGHKTVFSERSWRALLGQAGFAVVGRPVYQVEHPYTLGIGDDACTVIR
jgi:hypothetical protein